MENLTNTSSGMGHRWDIYVVDWEVESIVEYFPSYFFYCIEFWKYFKKTGTDSICQK